MRSSGGTESYCPNAGDLISLDFSPQAGREQAGKRPAIVLSTRNYNRLSRLCVVCPITSSGKGYPFEVTIPAGLAVTGFVLSDQVRSLSWLERSAAFLASCPEGVLAEVRAKIKALLQM